MMSGWDMLELREHLWKYQHEEEQGRLVPWAPPQQPRWLRGWALAWLRGWSAWVRSLRTRSAATLVEPRFGATGR